MARRRAAARRRVAGTASSRAAVAFVDGAPTGVAGRLEWATASWAYRRRRPDRARAAELGGRLALETGDGAAGTSALRAAQREYDALGAVRLSRDVRARLREAGARSGARGVRVWPAPAGQR